MDDAPEQFNPAAASVKSLKSHLLRLPEDAREHFYRILGKSLRYPPPASDEEIAKGWAEEAHRRWIEYSEGRIEAIPAEEVLAEIRTRLKR